MFSGSYLQSGNTDPSETDSLSGASGTVTASQLQGPGFDPELVLLSVWRNACSPGVHEFMPGSPVSHLFKKTCLMANSCVCAVAQDGVGFHAALWNQFHCVQDEMISEDVHMNVNTKRNLLRLTMSSVSWYKLTKKDFWMKMLEALMYLSQAEKNMNTELHKKYTFKQ